ncbi:PDR/VanB family oxidoreductase [Rhodococcus wratislaviensis]|uniref:PDR/VanB family oxidoreductase n=1 Tax=Rhodococcus wratislaviensis TaxID=44752 RepID=UPI003662062A
MNASDMKVRTRVARKVSVADRVVELTFAPEGDAPLPAWEPGAHADLYLANGTVRQYSLCGDPERNDQWRIAVLHEVESRGGSSFIHDELSEGSLLDLSMPRNHFALHDADAYLFVAGGIGITPILPMIDHAARQGKPWRLVYGGRSRKNMPYLNELETKPGGKAELWPQDERGMMDLDFVLNTRAANEVVYACGPGPMLEALEAKCDETVPLHIERFRATPLDATDSDSFEVELSASGKRLTVPAERSLLSLLLEEGVDVDWSCEEGTCGTCEVDVLEGVPEHRDSVLTAAERATNSCMMVCVSRSKTPLLVLDL